MPDVSVVIVSFNTAERLARTLDALGPAADGLAVETIVVDNASTDGTRTMLAEKFPDVRLVLNTDNVGFARACNAGARLATGRAVLFLNSDCELEAGALATMLRALDEAPGVGAVLPRLVNPDGTLQPSVHDGFPGPWSVLGEVCFLSSLRYAIYRRRRLARWALARERARHLATHDVAWGGAACLLVRREALAAVGGFDERFFMYWEDVDLGRRLGAAGWRLRYVAEAQAVHHWGASAAQRPPAALIAPWVSRLRYFAKHFPAWGASVAYPILALDLGVRRAAYGGLALLPGRREWGRTRAADARGSTAAVAREASALGARAAGTTLLLALIVGFAAVRYGHDVVKFLLTSDFIDFAHYYTHARIVAEGGNPFDPAALAAMDQRLGIIRAPGDLLYPPLFYLFFQPWLQLPFRMAAVGWLVISQVVLALVVGATLRRYPPAGLVSLAAALYVTLNFQPLYESLVVGQVNVGLLGLVALAWSSARAGHPWIAGLALAGAIHTKPHLALLVPLLLLARERRVAVTSTVATLGAFGVSLVVFGWTRHADWLASLFGPGGYRYVFPWNISARAVLARVLAPAAPDVAVIETLSMLFGLAAIALSVPVLRRRPLEAADVDGTWMLAVTLVALVAPMIEEHHLTLLLLPVLFLVLTWDARSSVRDQGLVLAGVLLLASRYSAVQFPAAQTGWLGLLLLGKVVGAGLIAFVIARRLGRPRATATVAEEPAPRARAVLGHPLAPLIALALGFAATRYVHDLMKFVILSDFIDFAHYFTYARLVAEGANPFDPAAVAAMDARLALPRSPGAADYPPVFYLLVQPWTWLPFRPGALAWLGTAQVWLAATAVMVARAVPAPSPARVAAVLFLVLCYQPLYEELAVGQANVLVLALVTAAWYAARSGRAWLGGAALGIAVHVKPQYGLLVPLLAVAGRFDVAVRATVAIAAGFAIGLVILGPAHYVAWVEEIASGGFQGVFAWNVAPRAILQRLVPGGFAAAVTLVLDAVVLFFVVRALRQRAPGAQDGQWGLAVTSVILVSPMLEEHHFVLLLLPLALLVLTPPGTSETTASRTDVADTTLVLAGALLLASRYSFVRFHEVQSGVAALLLAGKWLGAAALAWALVRRVRAT